MGIICGRKYSRIVFSHLRENVCDLSNQFSQTGHWLILWVSLCCTYHVTFTYHVHLRDDVTAIQFATPSRKPMPIFKQNWNPHRFDWCRCLPEVSGKVLLSFEFTRLKYLCNVILVSHAQVSISREYLSNDTDTCMTEKYARKCAKFANFSSANVHNNYDLLFH